MYLPRMLRSLTVVLVSLNSLALGSGCPLAKQEIHAVDSGFRIEHDAFSFQNFGGQGRGAVLTANHVMRMFGSHETCETFQGGDCVPTPMARRWVKEVNRSMAGGRCEGFAVLSALMFMGDVDTATFGAASPFAVDEASQVTDEIAYWFSTQFLRNVVIGTTQVLSATETLQFFTTALANKAEMYRIGIARLDDEGRLHGGHAILPIAIVPGDEPNLWSLKVYDNNYPGEVRAIEIDVDADSWQYQASPNPGEESGLYVGNPSNGNLIYLAPVRARLGEHACPFCHAEAGADALAATFTSGGATLNAIDANGKQSGIVDGRMVNEIPGATIEPTFSLENWQDDAAPELFLPAHQSLTFELHGTDLEGGPAEFSIITGDVELGAEFAVIQPGEVDRAFFNLDEHRLRYEFSSTSNAHIYLVFNVDPGSEAEDEDECEIGVREGHADALECAQDAESGNVHIKIETSAPLRLDLQVQLVRDHLEADFDGVVDVPFAECLIARADTWAGEGAPMTVDVDVDCDDVGESSVTVQDTSLP